MGSLVRLRDRTPAGVVTAPGPWRGLAQRKNRVIGDVFACLLREQGPLCNVVRRFRLSKRPPPFELFAEGMRKPNEDDVVPSAEALLYSAWRYGTFARHAVSSSTLVTSPIPLSSCLLPSGNETHTAGTTPQAISGSSFGSS